MHTATSQGAELLPACVLLCCVKQGGICLFSHVQERKEQRRKQREWNNERVKYGKTSAGKYVDGQLLDKLCQLSYERSEAAEALRQHDNDLSVALDVLSDPVRRGALQLSMVAAKVSPGGAGLPTSQHCLTSHACSWRFSTGMSIHIHDSWWQLLLWQMLMAWLQPPPVLADVGDSV